MKTLFYSLSAILLLLSGCTKSPDNGKNPNFLTLDPKSGNGFTFYTNNSLFSQSEKDAGLAGTKPFNIDSVTRAGNILNVKVSFSSSCPSPAFSVIWDGAILESYPYMVSLVLKLNDGDCAGSKVQVTKTIAIDISSYIGQFALDPKTQFNILNGSNVDQDIRSIPSN